VVRVRLHCLLIQAARVPTEYPTFSSRQRPRQRFDDASREIVLKPKGVADSNPRGGWRSANCPRFAWRALAKAPAHRYPSGQPVHQERAAW